MAIYQSSNKNLSGKVFNTIAKDGLIEIADSDIEVLEPLLKKFYGCKRVDNADANDNGEITRDELKAKLDDLGVDYPNRGKHSVLMAIYQEQLK